MSRKQFIDLLNKLGIYQAKQMTDAELVTIYLELKRVEELIKEYSKQ
ncbi:hypothetical protein HMI01_14910 [Halolactibacillus miurensis]|uniref:Fur-regulated basic protein A n=1 Tax=Halolactibacillus miurensis TaxID=306541 RepID=A0ABQ0VTM7_9BACI|nr:hypothetical protein [Halolactibacillus miurensis]GEM04503.1 hypothetical protein HMI01_14910 [Halolactibacillus miurensis]